MKLRPKPKSNTIIFQLQMSKGPLTSISGAISLNVSADCGCMLKCSTRDAGVARASLLRGVVFGVVHRPDDDDLLQPLGGGGRRPQLLHQSMEGV